MLPEWNSFINADCMEYLKEFPDNYFDLTLTDIPYAEVNQKRGGGKLRVVNKSNADVIRFDMDLFLQEIYRVTKGTIIIFCGQKQMSYIFDYYCNTDATVRQIIWEKSNPSPMNGEKIYLSGIENAVWARKPKATFNAFCKNTVFRYPVGDSKIHPTEKNHELLMELIGDNSNVGDSILDPCCGSASTLLVANLMGRRYIGFEIDNNYYKKAQERLSVETAQINIFDLIGE